MGGGSAALTGGDPFKGALMGAVTGGAGAGISSGITALNPAATATLPAAPAATAGTTAAGADAGIAGLEGFADTTASMANNISTNPSLYPAGSTAANASTTFNAGAQPFATPPVGAAPSGVAGSVERSAADVIKAALDSDRSNSEGTFLEGVQRVIQDPIASIKRNVFPAASGALAGAVGAREEEDAPSTDYNGPLRRFKYSPDVYRPQFAEGGITSLTTMPVERMSDRNDMMAMMANKGQMYAEGGISSLGSYSDGGRMLKGPGDGMSDSIPASIAGRRPARLATEEFVVPADVVSHLGNGSSDAGAKQLYAMMDRVRSARTGTKKQGRQIRPQSMMPA
jgi:hypothetical protein